MSNSLGVEIPVLDLEKGITFYESAFGWKFDREKYPDQGVFDLNEFVQIGLFQTEKARPKGLNIGLEVEDIDATVSKIKEAGGKIVKDKFAFASGEQVAVFQDPSGNELSLWQKD